MADGSWQGFIHMGVLTLMAGNVFAAIVGLLMIIAPTRLASWSRVSDRWVSTRAATDTLDQMRNVDGQILSRPKLAGIIILAGAAFILVEGVFFVRRIGVSEGGHLLSEFLGGSALAPGVWEALWLSLLVFLFLGALLALVVGALAVFRTDLLQKVSQQANRWVSTNGSVKALDAPHYRFDGLVRNRPRLWGTLIVLFAAYALVVLSFFSRSL
ncbi:MAG: hypothetical protein ACE5FE_01510 [Acidiferrobacterales bacterium]